MSEVPGAESNQRYVYDLPNQPTPSIESPAEEVVLFAVLLNSEPNDISFPLKISDNVDMGSGRPDHLGNTF